MSFFNFIKNKKNSKNISADSNDLLNYIRKNLNNPSDENVLKVLEKVAKPDDDLEHLTPDGELPWGWHSHTKGFTIKIEKEYSYFLDKWINSKRKSPKELFNALKSFVTYLEDVENLCKSKGECYEFWFREILTTPDYITKRKNELNELSQNLEALQRQYEKKKSELSNLDSKITKILIENDGILQSDFIKKFDPLIENEVREKLYYLSKEGKLQRIKTGRSYTLHYNSK